MSKKALGELTEDDIAAGAARAQRLCAQVPDECRAACRSGVQETERQLRQHPTVLRKRKVELDGIRPDQKMRAIDLCMDEYKGEASRFACSNGVRFAGLASSKKGPKRPKRGA